MVAPSNEAKVQEDGQGRFVVETSGGAGWHPEGGDYFGTDDGLQGLVEVAAPLEVEVAIESDAPESTIDLVRSEPQPNADTTTVVELSQQLFDAVAESADSSADQYATAFLHVVRQHLDSRQR